MCLEICKEVDANLNLLKGKRLAILGFGSQGRAHALNLRDSGFQAQIALRADSPTQDQAISEGFKVVTVAQATQFADILLMAIADMEQPKVYRESIAPNLREGQTLIFCHALCVRESWIVPPAAVNFTLLAPLGPGSTLRHLYLKNSGLSCLIARAQNASESSLAMTLAWAKAIGCTRKAVFKTSFEQECVVDLFCEQAVLCGGVSNLVQGAFEALIEAGYPKELAYFSCLQELKLTVELMCDHGPAGMLKQVSDTAAYGATTQDAEAMHELLKPWFSSMLEKIESGSFARAWRDEYQQGAPRLKAKLQQRNAHPLQKAHDDHQKTCAQAIDRKDDSQI